MGPPISVIVLAGLLAGPSPAVAQARSAAVVPISPKGGAAATSFLTKPGRPYSITVTGSYSFDGRLGLSDCGHKDPAGPPAWENNSNINLDGTPARCVTMPFDETHTYRWRQYGTGEPFVFAIPGGSTYTADDTGYLLAIVVEE